MHYYLSTSSEKYCGEIIVAMQIAMLRKYKIFSNQLDVFRGQATFMYSVKLERLSNMQSLLHNIMVIVVCRVGSEHYSINKI